MPGLTLPSLLERIFQKQQRMIQHTTRLKEPLRRRARLLFWILVTLIVLLVGLFLYLVFANGQDNPTHGFYLVLVLGSTISIGIASYLNYSGNYVAAANITVGTAIIATWGSILIDPSILKGDFVPLTYTVLVVYLAAILLTIRAMVAIAFIQMLFQITLPWLFSEDVFINWPSLITFFIFTSILSIVHNVISRMDINQIEKQNIEMARNQEKLRELSIRDPLTNLFNRRYLEEVLERELIRAERENFPISMVMLDIDHFKNLNDSYGHAAGDLVLAKLSQHLQKFARKSDVVCRYGGEELIMILYNMPLKLAVFRAEAIRKSASEIKFDHEDDKVQGITISIGISSYPEHGSKMQTLLLKADAALYSAKRSGRNRVEVFSEGMLMMFENKK